MTSPQHTQGPDDAHTAELGEQVITDLRVGLTGIFHSLENVAAGFVHVYQNVRTQGRTLTESDLATLRPSIQNELAQQTSSDGLGVVVAPGVLTGHTLYLEWWRHAGKGMTPMRLNLDEASPDLYDYVRMDWFTIPRDEGRPAVVGPYVDFSGADRYVLTIAIPVSTQDRFLGIAGTDVRMSDLEPRLVTTLSRCHRDAVIVNAERRVVAANTSRWLPGSKIAQIPGSETEEFAWAGPVGSDTGWILGIRRTPSPAS